ncbi:MAG: complex I subunit 5 family protein, partial [Alphaproteobacteria bacterium]
LALVAIAYRTIGGEIQIAGWPVPLGIGLRLDGIAWIFLAFSALVFALAALAGRTTLARDGAATLWTTLLAGVNAIYLGADLFNLFVGLEVVSLSAVALTAIGGGAAAASAALRYLFVGLGGGLLYLMAVAVFYRAAGTLDIALIAQAKLQGAALAAPLALATAGLLLKSGAAPFHFWLPPAHGNAASAVSAVLSAVVVKTGLYLLFRMWIDVAPEPALSQAAPLFWALSVAGMVTGGAGALRAARVKTLIAYSTVAQISYMVLALGFAAAASGAAVAFAAFAAAHALAKSGLFIAAGLITRANGHDEVSRLADPGAAYGPTKIAVAISAGVLAGLPPTAGFFAKWTLMQEAAAAGAWWVAPALVAGGLLTAAYMSRLAAALMRNPPGDRPTEETGSLQGWSALALSVSGLVLGFLGAPLAGLVEAGP